MDLIREILFALEKADDTFVHPSKIALEAKSGAEISHHLVLLEDAGLLTRSIITITKGSGILGEQTQRQGASVRMTWQGHEFLDTIRDPEIWRKTKVVCLLKSDPP